jgi:ATP adenylyltransferase/5',5'''-P-1,P-4-tetraphosphate phosphorylase II
MSNQKPNILHLVGSIALTNKVCRKILVELQVVEHDHVLFEPSTTPSDEKRKKKKKKKKKSEKKGEQRKTDTAAHDGQEKPVIVGVFNEK